MATLITGNTYPVRDQIKALGGRWNAEAKGWMVPDDRAEEARKLVAGAPAKTHTQGRSWTSAASGAHRRTGCSCRHDAE